MLSPEELLEEYLETTHFDEDVDWREEPLTEEDPDEEEE